MKIITDKGTIHIQDSIIAVLSGYAALNCFGVKGMTVRNLSDELVLLIRGENLHKGVRVRENGAAGVAIELHIAVHYGVNMSAIAKAVMKEVKYVVQKQTGIPVSKVDVHVDSVCTD